MVIKYPNFTDQGGQEERAGAAEGQWDEVEIQAHILSCVLSE